MPPTLRTALTLLAIAATALPAAAQTARTKAPAKAVTYDNVLALVRAGTSPADILAGCDTVFTLAPGQLDELKEAGAPAALIGALKSRRIAIGDVTDFVVVLDCSGSMRDEIAPGQTKMDAAKKVVGELFKAIPNGRNLAFVVYGHDASLQCKAVKVVRPLKPVTAQARAELARELAALKPAGHTPIAASLKEAGRVLGRDCGLAQIVVITDGAETCHGDPALEAETLAITIPNLRAVEVIGVGLKDDKEKEAVAVVAKRGRGKFYDTDSADELKRAVAAAVAVPEVAVVAEKPAPQKKPAVGLDDKGFAAKKLHELKEHTDRVSAVAFSPDGAVLATASGDMTVRLWDMKTGGRLQRIRNQAHPYCLAFSPDGKQLAVGSDKSAINVYEVASGEQVKKLDTTGSVALLAYSPDGALLAAVADDSLILQTMPVGKSVALWDTSTDKVVRTLKGHDSTINELAFAPDGKLLATVSDDKTTRLWDVAAGAEADILRGHQRDVLAVAFSADGQTLVTGGDDNTLIRYGVKNGSIIKPVFELTPGEYGQVRRVAYLPSGRLWCSRWFAGNAVLDPATGKTLHESPLFRGTYSLMGKSYQNHRVALSPDGKTYAEAHGNDVVIYDASREFGAEAR